MSQYCPSLRGTTDLVKEGMLCKRYRIDELNASLERLSQRVCNDGEQFCAQMTPGTNQRSKPVHTATLGRTESKGGDTHLRGNLAELLAGTASAPRAQRSRGTPCRICPPPERQVLSSTYEIKGEMENVPGIRAVVLVKEALGLVLAHVLLQQDVALARSSSGLLPQCGPTPFQKGDEFVVREVA